MDVVRRGDDDAGAPSSQQSSHSGGSSQQSRHGGDGVSHHKRERWVRRLQMASFLAVSFSDGGRSAHIEQTDTALGLRKHKIFRELLRQYTHAMRDPHLALALLKCFASPSRFPQVPSEVPTRQQAHLVRGEDQQHRTGCKQLF